MARRHRNPNSAIAHVEREPGAVAVDNPSRSEPFERNVSGASKVLEGGGKRPKQNAAPKNERRPARK